MIVKNIRHDLAYKNSNHIVMMHNSLNITLEFDHRIIYSFISNFEDGLDVKYIYELMEPKGWTKDYLDECIDFLLVLHFIEDISGNTNLDKMKREFEEFKRHIFGS
ncbi:hypothetical protein [Romboutsia sp.]|uniref:hypothetical protein n=1 Tax=Romboutsia sp. TaxID=1965302 RepID=UPI003F39742A